MKTANTTHSDSDAHPLLESGGIARKVVGFESKETIFSQGDASIWVMYIQRGTVKLSVVSTAGKEAVVAMLGPGDFLGEEGLAGQATRMVTATAVAPTTVLRIDRQEMLRLLHSQRKVSDLFISYMLKRRIRIEEDLIDQFFNYTEKRLARTLLQLARYGKEDKRKTVIPKVTQETLAEMVGSTRSRVNLLMNRFRKMGFIEYSDEIHINSSLQSVVLD